MRRGPERTTETPPILQFIGIKKEGDVDVGEFVFNGPGLLQHAKRNNLELPPEVIETLEKINWEIGADLEGKSSLDDLDRDFVGNFINDLAALAEEGLTEAGSWQ